MSLPLGYKDGDGSSPEQSVNVVGPKLSVHGYEDVASGHKVSICGTFPGRKPTEFQAFLVQTFQHAIKSFSVKDATPHLPVGNRKVKHQRQGLDQSNLIKNNKYETIKMWSCGSLFTFNVNNNGGQKLRMPYLMSH